MLVILDFAALALHVYKNSVEIEKYLGNYIKASLNASTNQNYLFDQVDGIYEVILDPTIQDNPGDAFYASFYVKIIQQHAVAAVVAVRGSDDLSNDAQDIATWGNHVLGIQEKLNNMPDYTGPALNFLKQVNNYCQNQLKLSPLQIYLSGHSLGGAIAALMKAKFSMPNRVVTFNAPGIHSMSGVKIDTLGIVNIRARYDFVSTIDYPIGPCWDIDVPQDEAAAKQAFTLYHEDETISHLSLLQKLKNKLILTDDVIIAARAQHSIDNLYAAIKVQSNVSIGLRSFDNLVAMNTTAKNYDYSTT